MHHEMPLEGALVLAYTEPAGAFVKKPAFPPVVSDASGNFSLELPKGQYFLAAMKKKTSGVPDSLEPGDLYSFYGGNPITVDPARKAKLTLNMVPKPMPMPMPETPSGEDKGGVEGAATFDGQPMDGVVLFVYLDANDGFRGMGYYMSPPTGVSGSFKFRMNEGTYYIVARKRMNGELAGPLKDGDYFGYLDTNPVVVRKGRIAHVEIPMMKKIERAAPGGQGMTLVTGVIKDAAGNPAPGMYACLYKSEGMTDRPACLSRPTGPDGMFRLEVPLGGKYYLGARSLIGGPLEPGQYWGRFTGTPDHSVTVETGRTVEGLEIKVERIEDLSAE
ncbi:MAG TPA: hypothetical protein VJM83_03240 [Nitrospirota bacterium]|nr:hypothetical protein [Nitrospirota bacterium]